MTKQKARRAAHNATTRREASRLNTNTSQSRDEGKPVPYPVGKLWFKGAKIALRHNLSFETTREILFKDLSLICVPGGCVYRAAKDSLQEGLR